MPGDEVLTNGLFVWMPIFVGFIGLLFTFYARRLHALALGLAGLAIGGFLGTAGVFIAATLGDFVPPLPVFAWIVLVSSLLGAILIFALERLVVFALGLVGGFVLWGAYAEPAASVGLGHLLAALALGMLAVAAHKLLRWGLLTAAGATFTSASAAILLGPDRAWGSLGLTFWTLTLALFAAGMAFQALALNPTTQARRHDGSSYVAAPPASGSPPPAPPDPYAAAAPSFASASAPTSFRPAAPGRRAAPAQLAYGTTEEEVPLVQVYMPVQTVHVARPGSFRIHDR